jgi:hypothetical protein
MQGTAVLYGAKRKASTNRRSRVKNCKCKQSLPFGGSGWGGRGGLSKFVLQAQAGLERLTLMQVSGSKKSKKPFQGARVYPEYSPTSVQGQKN